MDDVCRPFFVDELHPMLLYVRANVQFFNTLWICPLTTVDEMHPLNRLAAQRVDVLQHVNGDVEQSKQHKILEI